MSRNTVHTTKNSFQVLHSLKRNGETTLAKLAADLEMAKSTVHKHLQTLVDEGYVVKSDTTYRLGLRFLELGELVREDFTIASEARPKVDALASETGELANLIVEETGEGVYVYTNGGEQAVSIDTYPGKRVRLHSIASGKAILAHMPERRRTEILGDNPLKKYTERTNTDREQLRKELVTIREEGVAFDRRERLPEMCCAAAPIVSHDGTVHGAVSVTGPAARMTHGRLEEVGEQVKQAAKIITINVQYRD